MIRNILQLFELLSYLYCFAAAYGKKMKYNIYTVIFVIAEMVLMTGLNEHNFPRYLISLSYVLMFLYCMINYKSTVKTTIVNCVISVLVVGIIQLILYAPLSFIISDEKADSLIRELIIMFLLFLIIFIFRNKMRLKSLSDFLIKRNKLLGVIGCFVLVVFGGQIWKMKQRGYVYGADYIPIVYFLLLLAFMIIEWQRTRTEAEKRKAQIEMNALYYNGYEELVRSVREKQHDFKNHMNAMRGMLYTVNDYDELVSKQKDYLDTILNEVEETSILTLIENPLLAGFLSDKIHEAESKGIVVRHECIYANEESKIPEYKLVEVMGILFDNAIEASCNNIGDGVICIKLWKEEKKFCFEITNKCSREELNFLSHVFDWGYSSKGKNRGVGLSKLKRIVREAEGEICVAEENLDGAPAIKFGIYLPI